MSFPVAPGIITPEEQARKLAIIATLTPAEIDAYQDEARRRGYFPGEVAAIHERRAQL